MSNWTHVAGVIRVDNLRIHKNEPDWDGIFGKELLFESSERRWNDAEKHPEKYLPFGSEGSLQKVVWINPDTSSMAAYTITIFGDLRDHDSAKEIIEWFKNKCKNLYVRQATITVENELNGTETWTYLQENEI